MRLCLHFLVIFASCFTPSFLLGTHPHRPFMLPMFRKHVWKSGFDYWCSGASSGLGELMAYEYAKRSAYLAIIAIKEPDSLLEQVADRARARGSPDVLSVFADVSKFDECRVFVDDTVKHFGHCR
ncbi:putative 11-beta-hydroxysteroid dehydrogenase [Helianthus annuus]|nr:putative 11-beta-hydroxysteroid dehydrogenase [Helianthus annuus]KAJ0635248.1 putative 11-beta-hydroxysteroid dehydrogenase [Helianthus annuus]